MDDSKSFYAENKGQYPVLHPTYDGMHYAETMTLEKLKNLRKNIGDMKKEYE